LCGMSRDDLLVAGQCNTKTLISHREHNDSPWRRAGWRTATSSAQSTASDRGDHRSSIHCHPAVHVHSARSSAPLCIVKTKHHVKV
jgi:hypothetical protein